MVCRPTGLSLTGGRLLIYDCDICPFRLRNVPHQQDTRGMKSVGISPDLQPADIKGTCTHMQQLHHNRGQKSKQIRKKIKHSHRKDKDSQRKDNCAASQETKWGSWSSNCNSNVNVLIVFIVCDALASFRREQISHCNIRISTYSYIFLSELKRDEKAEGKETWLPISNSQWNTNSHEAIFV